MNHDKATATLRCLYDAATAQHDFMFSTERHDLIEPSKTFVMLYGGVKSQYDATRINTIEEESQQDANKINKSCSIVDQFVYVGKGLYWGRSGWD